MRTFLALTPNPEVNVLAANNAREVFSISDVKVLLTHANTVLRRSAERQGFAPIDAVWEDIIEWDMWIERGEVESVDLTVGEKQEITVGQSILSQTMKHTMVATQKFTISTPGASIEMDASGITIKAFTVKVQSPSVDFNMGMPSQAASIAVAKPPKGKLSNANAHCPIAAM